MKSTYIGLALFAAVASSAFATPEVTEVGSAGAQTFKTIGQIKPGPFKEMAGSIFPADWTLKIGKTAKLDYATPPRPFETWVTYVFRISGDLNLNTVINWKTKTVEFYGPEPKPQTASGPASASAPAAVKASAPVAATPQPTIMPLPTIAPLPTITPRNTPSPRPVPAQSITVPGPRDPVRVELPSAMAPTGPAVQAFSNIPLSQLTRLDTPQPRAVPTAAPAPVAIAAPVATPTPELSYGGYTPAQKGSDKTSRWSFELTDTYMSKALTRWARSVGLAVEWNASTDYLIPDRKEFTGDFVSVIAQIDKALYEAGVPFGLRIGGGKLESFDRPQNKQR